VVLLVTKEKIISDLVLFAQMLGTMLTMTTKVIKKVPLNMALINVTKEEVTKNPRTEFQMRVYSAIQKIPKGKITSYGALAKVLGSSPRAVGQALRNNPFAPIVPCHRVVAAEGKLGGFSGQTSGEKLQKKMKLLSDEGVKFVQIQDTKSKSDFFSYTLSEDVIKSVLLDAEQLAKFVTK
jgi:methylated-DNA-[protein]-cysteine S-methyltransferase